MKKILIHSNNTSFNQIELFPVSEQFVFDVDFDKDVDFYIDEKLNDVKLKSQLEDADIVFIKVSLSQNYLEYFGIRLAYHIRLTKSLGAKANIPMVFIAEESIQFLGITYPEPSILFTGGIYLIKESMEDYNKVTKWIGDGIIKPLEHFHSFINAIHINPPANYQSHHSIANEWALARYFSMLERDGNDEGYITLEKKINELDYLRTLHFKYTEAKASRQKFNPRKHAYTPIIKGIEDRKIGVIDDEIDKGWLAFYDYLFRKSNAESLAFGDFRKDESREKLVSRIQGWLSENFESNNPIDIFIIDLRLHDDDFSELDFDKLSGVLIIKFIKSANPGIQIVVSTASNKVWNFQKCLEYGVDFFAIKESPETNSDREETKQSLIHLCKEISKAAEKSFLADLYRNVEDICKNSYFGKEKVEIEFKNLTFEKNGLIDQIVNLLILDHKKEAIINQCLLIAFQILENYCDLSSVAIFDFKNSSGKVCHFNNTTLIDIFTLSTDSKHILTKLDLVRSRFGFQNTNAKETITSFTFFEEPKLLSTYSSSVDATSLIKIISVLHFRHAIPKAEIERIIALRYYRSNVAAHLTGNVQPEYKIAANDLIFIIELFSKVFIK